MQLSNQQLFGLPVQTISHQHLGVVVGITLDTEQHVIMQYQVRTWPVIGQVLLISSSQVVRLTNELMVVDDTTTPVAQSAVPAL